MKYLVIGPPGAGKTDFCYAMAGLKSTAKKTKNIEFIGDYIDTPGIYSKYPRFYRRLIVTCQQAALVIFLVAEDQKGFLLPQGFSQVFCRPSIGVINKAEPPKTDFRDAEAILSYAGVGKPYFYVSVHAQQDLTDLKNRINSIVSRPGR